MSADFNIGRYQKAIDRHAADFNSLSPSQQREFYRFLQEEVKKKYSDDIAVSSALGLAERTPKEAPRNGKKGNGSLSLADHLGEYEIPKPTIALELMERDMPPISYLREPWISEGLNIMAGRPKLGKTTLLRQKLAAVAGGWSFFGCEGAQAPALFLSLEEGDRLARKKFELAGFDDAALSSILIYFKWRRGKDGVCDLLRVLDAYPAVRFVGIDSLTRFRDVPDQRMPAFTCDYEAVSALHAVAKSRPGLCIDLVHHTRKAKSDDPLDDISGTYGLSAACDSYWVMRYHEDGAVLHVGGRLWESDTSQFQLRRGRQVWELAGEFTGTSTTQNETLDALRSANGMTPSQLATLFKIKRGSAFDRLSRLVALGVVYSNDGRYFVNT